MCEKRNSYSKLIRSYTRSTSLKPTSCREQHIDVTLYKNWIDDYQEAKFLKINARFSKKHMRHFASHKQKKIRNPIFLF